MLTQSLCKTMEEIKTGPYKDRLDPIEVDWLQGFATKFSGPDLNPCIMSLQILSQLHEKATVKNWVPKWG